MNKRLKRIIQLARERWVPITVAAAALAVALAGAGGYILYRRADPMNRAQRLEAAGDVRGAELQLRTAVQAAPRNAAAHLALARLQLKVYDGAGAEKELKLALRLGTDPWIVTPLLGDAYLQQGRWKEILAEIPSRAPQPEVTGRLLLQRATAQIATSDLISAQTTLAMARRSVPTLAETSVIAAELAAAQGNQAEERAQLDEGLARDPDQFDALILKGQLLEAAGDHAAALVLIDRAATARPFSILARLERASLHIALNQDAPAQADITFVRQNAPRDLRGVYFNAILLARAGRYADSAVAFDQLQSAVEQFPRANYLDAMVMVNLGNIESAADLARRYHTRFPGDTDGALLLARIALLAKRPEQAVAALQPVVAAGHADAAVFDVLGRAFAALGDRFGARRALQEAANKAPDNATIRTQLGVAQVMAGDLAGGTATLDHALTLDAKQPAATEALFTVQLDTGNLDQAGATLARLQAVTGNTERTGILSATLLMARGQMEPAQTALAGLLRTWPDSIDARVLLAKVLVLQGRQPEGKTQLEAILAKSPANSAALTAYLQLILQGTDLTPALQALAAASAAAPSDPLLLAMQTDMMVRAGQAPRAAELLERKRDAGPLPVVLQGALARAQAASGMTGDAKQTYTNQLLASPTDLEARRALTELLLRDKDYAAARVVVRAGLVLLPGTYGMMSVLVGVAAQTDGLDAALAEAAALRADPANMPAAGLLKGDLLMQLLKYGDALQAFQSEAKAGLSTALVQRIAAAYQGLKQDDEAAAALRPWCAAHPSDTGSVVTLAGLDVKAKRWDLARAGLQNVLAARPDDVTALNNLAWIYQLQHDPRARALAQRAYLNAPGPRTADTLGWIMVQDNDAAAAIPLLRQASDPRAPNEDAIYHLAAAMVATGDQSGAAVLLQNLLTGSATFDTRQEAQTLLNRLANK